MSVVAPAPEAVHPNAATIVSEKGRPNFLPALFGRKHFFLAERIVYNFLEWLSADYKGGYWQFYEASGFPLYLAPTAGTSLHITCRSNGYEGEVSPDAAGIIACLFTFSHLSFEIEDDHITEVFHRLRDYAGDHPEAAAIFSAID